MKQGKKMQTKGAHPERTRSTGPQVSTERPQPRRRYDSSLRKDAAAERREDMLEAACNLAREAETWDFSHITIAAVANRAGVSERSVYRQFASKEGLREAVVERLEDIAGVRYADFSLDALPSAVTGMFRTLPAFSATVAGAENRFPAVALRRRNALLDALGAETPGWSERERHMVAGILDVLWTPLTYQRLAEGWELDEVAAAQAVTWAVELLVQGVRAGRRPANNRRTKRKRV